MAATGGAFTPIRRYAWVILLIRAMLALALGIVVVATREFRPGLANVIAVYWLLGGLLTLRWARAHRHERGERVGYGAALAAFAAAFAVFARGLIKGAVQEDLMLAFVGMFSVVIGLLRVSGMFRESVTEEIRRSRPEAMVLGILEIALGIVLIFGSQGRPIIVPVLGIWGIVGGAIMLADAIRAWRVFHRAPAASTSSAAPPGADSETDPSG